MLLGQYRSAGFPGTLVAVHPEAAEVDGVPAVPSLRDVPRRWTTRWWRCRRRAARRRCATPRASASSRW
ncbi:hypothetical protein ACFQXA_16230 [Nocardiopsis composta]